MRDEMVRRIAAGMDVPLELLEPALSPADMARLREQELRQVFERERGHTEAALTRSLRSELTGLGVPGAREMEVVFDGE